MSKDKILKHYSFSESIRSLFLVYIGIIGITISVFIFLNANFFTTKLNVIVNYLSGTKFWWAIAIVFFIGNSIIRKVKLQLHTALIALILSLFIGLITAIFVLKTSNDAKLIAEFLDTIFTVSLFLVISSLLSMLIVLNTTILKYVVQFRWIAVVALFLGQMIFFEEYFFSYYNNPELNATIVPFIERYLLFLVFLAWITINAGLIVSADKRSNTLSALVFFAFIIVLYFTICKNTLIEGTCETINYDCVKKLWKL